MQREGICKNMASRIVSRVLSVGTLKAARTLVRPLHKEVKILDSEVVMIRIVSNEYYDYNAQMTRGKHEDWVHDSKERAAIADAETARKERERARIEKELRNNRVSDEGETRKAMHRDKDEVCESCARRNLLRRLDLSTTDPSFFGWRTSLDVGVCTCVVPRVPERIRVHAYNSVTKAMYMRIVSESELRERILMAVKHGDLRHDSLLARASRLESLPTDQILGLDVGNNPPRTRFEPIRESREASRRAKALTKRAQWLRGVARDAHNKSQKARSTQHKTSLRRAALTERFNFCHSNFLRGSVHREAMKQAAADAISFSKRQLEMYENKTENFRENAWDPLEDASNHKFIRRKRAAILAMFRHAIRRFVAYTRLWRCNFQLRERMQDAKEAEENAQEAERIAKEAEVKAERAREQANIARTMVFIPSISFSLCLTHKYSNTGTRRDEVFNILTHTSNQVSRSSRETFGVECGGMAFAKTQGSRTCTWV